jgi:hypothetical protein
MSIGPIHSALDKHLKALDGLPPTARENAKFEQPDNGAMYLKVNFMPASSDFGSLGINGTTHERGIYQVGISAPGGKGSGEAEDVADRIIEHFKIKTLGTVRTTLPTRSQAMPDEAGRIWLAVSVPYSVEQFF